MNDAIRRGEKEKSKKPRRNQGATQLCMFKDDDGAETRRDREGRNRAPRGYLDRVYVAEHDGMHQKETDSRPTVAAAGLPSRACGREQRRGAARRGRERHSDSLVAQRLRVPLPQKRR